MKNPTIIAGLFLSLLLPNFKDMAKVMQIPLTQGEVALVDKADFKWLNQWKWGLDSKGKCRNHYIKYAKRGIRLGGKTQKTIFMHRLILGLTDPNVICDHKDHNGLNNQRSNLRIATRSQNAANRIKTPNGTSKYLGVSWHSIGKKWVVHVSGIGIKKHVGMFENEIDAALAYNREAYKIHGKFASLNIIIKQNRYENHR